MKRLTVSDANSYLKPLNFEIGDWNSIANKSDKRFQISHRAPRDAARLFGFSQHVAGWLPNGNWKLFQVDNSTSFNAVETSFINRLLGNSSELNLNRPENRTMLFEFGSNIQESRDTELQISFLVFLFLLFEQHAYLVSSGSTAGELLAIQDGSIIFSSLQKDVCGAQELLKQFDAKPASDPTWIQEIVRVGQERDIKGAH